MEILFSFPCLKSAVKEMLQYKLTHSNISRHSSFASAAQAATACSAAKAASAVSACRAYDEEYYRERERENASACKYLAGVQSLSVRK